MDELRYQAMIVELEQQRMLVVQQFGTRCAELQAALATANARIRELEKPPKRVRKQPKPTE